MYATVVTELPFPQFWAVLFFLVFIFLGLDTQVTSPLSRFHCIDLNYSCFFHFATVEVVRMTLQKFIKQSFNKAGGWVADLVAIALCVACFIGSFPYITQVFTMCHHFFVFKLMHFFFIGWYLFNSFDGLLCLHRGDYPLGSWCISGHWCFLRCWSLS